MIQAYSAPAVSVDRASRVSRPSFWDDRQAVRLKVLLLGLCLVAAAMLEVPW
jgi:hypothetical protein